MSQPLKLRNHILSRLPDDEAARVFASLDPIELPLGFLIAAPGRKVDYVYFLEEGIGSVVAVSPDGNKAEAGMFGWEGFAPVSVIAGADTSPHEVVVQSPGHGHRIEVETLYELLEHCQVLRDLLVKSALSLAAQVTYTALSNATHQVDERLARWLLMCHDRVDGDSLSITHEYISVMLAVRRPSVTTSLHVLEGNRFIRSERKLVTIRNRTAMEEFAHDAYGKPEEEHRRLFGENPMTA
jgi:CRP-like cAMP-binding protein